MKAKGFPSTMAAVKIDAYGDWHDVLGAGETVVDRPGRNQILVKVNKASINPSDMDFIRGHYGIKKPLPAVPGWEGCGVVVATGDGDEVKRMLGKRVACIAPNDKGGSWAEYMISTPELSIILPDDLGDEQGALRIVNSLTAWALMKSAEKEGHGAVIHTAAGGSLGAMMCRLSERLRIPGIYIVHKESQKDELMRRGARHVLCSREDGFVEALRRLSSKLSATMAFDAVAGEMTGLLFKSMPADSVVVVYGALSGAACHIPPRNLIFRKQQVRGFYLVDWLQNIGREEKMDVEKKLWDVFGQDFMVAIKEVVPLPSIRHGLARYEDRTAAGKILVSPTNS